MSLKLNDTAKLPSKCSTHDERFRAGLNRNDDISSSGGMSPVWFNHNVFSPILRLKCLLLVLLLLLGVSGVPGRISSDHSRSNEANLAAESRSVMATPLYNNRQCNENPDHFHHFDTHTQLTNGTLRHSMI